MECIHEIAISWELLKALGLLSWSLVGFTVVDDMREGIGGQGLGDTMGWGTGGGIWGWNADNRERWGWAVRNSLAIRMLCSRVNKVFSLQARVLADCCCGTVVSSSSVLEGKKLDSGWFLEILDGESGYKGSCQLELFEVETVVVCEGIMLVGKRSEERRVGKECA